MEWQGFIPESRYSELQAKITKLNKRAVKIGVPPMTLELTGQHRRDESDYPHVCIYVEIILKGETPKMAGWKLLAVLQHDPNLTGNIVKTVPGEVIPQDYQTRPGVCDHCGYSRIRKETFVVQNTQGELKQVGRQCVADFLGHGDPRRFIKTWEYFEDAREWCEHGWPGLRDDRENYSLEAFVAMSIATIRKYGWVSGKKAYEEGLTSTATEVVTQFGDRRYLKEDEKVYPTEADGELALKVVEWARNITGSTDYEHNLKTIAECRYVIRKTQGYAASMVIAYKMANEPKKEKKVSNFYGTVGQKVKDLSLNFLWENSFPSTWGVVYLQTFNDDNGNRFIWMASGPQDFEAGHKYLVSGTIKAHREYKNIKQTALTRCKVKMVK